MARGGAAAGGISDNSIVFAVTDPSGAQDPLGGGHTVYDEKKVDAAFESYYFIRGWGGAFQLTTRGTTFRQSINT